MHSLSNSTLTISIAVKGAELQSIFNNETQLEYLWSALPAWHKHSPVLFPIVGGLKNGTYEYKGKSYQLPRHGFARDVDFTVTEQTEDSMTFSLHSSETTKHIYPFDFLFKITYRLHQNAIEITFTVENKSEETLFFSVGAHPAFSVPLITGLTYDDYYLQFDEEETAPRWPLNDEGLVLDEPVPLLVQNDRLQLRKDLFERDAIVFKNLRSTSISLLSDKSPHGVNVSFEGFPYMGIWAAKGADFVCIEPWCGIASPESASNELEEKEGIIALPINENWSKSYTIRVF